MLSPGPGRRRLSLMFGCMLAAASCSSLRGADDSSETTLATSTTATTSESITSSPSPQPAASDMEMSSVMSGIAVPRGNPASIAKAEAELGVEFSVVRVFARWNTKFPDADHREILDTGHKMHLSVRPRTDSGEVVPWADMASARPGSAVHDQMMDWADQIIEMGPGNYFTLNHEPETKDSARNGTGPEFVGAWRAFTEILRDQGGEDIKMVWVMTGGAFRDERADAWYPGDDVVDVISTDPYNWYQCQGSDRPWVSFEELVDPALDFAEAHGKPLSVAEFASVEDSRSPGRKAEWIMEAAATLATPRYQEGLEYVAWFNVTAPGGTWPDCVWNYDTSDESAEAFAALMRSLS